MTFTILGPIVVSLAVMMVTPGLAAEADSESAASAAELSALMGTRGTTVIAAADPVEPDRFIAAMIVPGVQLLVVPARYATPDLLRDEIRTHQYSVAYGALQQSSMPESRVFFQDLKADGLHLKPGAAVDVMYERVVNQTMFDGNPAAHKLTDAAYAAKFKAADAAYSRMLTALIQELRGSAPTP